LENTPTAETIELATALTIAWLENSNTRSDADDVPAFLRSMFDAVTRLSTGDKSGGTVEAAAVEYVPAVSVRKSLASPDHILSMIDGKPYRTLKRHLSGHGLTPAEYRERYGLRPDYPMVSETYSEVRRAMAKKIGLGRKPGDTVATQSVPQAAAPAKKVTVAKARAKLHLGDNAAPAPRKRAATESAQA
jgi:predicted transcriptional regulator